MDDVMIIMAAAIAIEDSGDYTSHTRSPFTGLSDE